MKRQPIVLPTAEQLVQYQNATHIDHNSQCKIYRDLVYEHFIHMPQPTTADDQWRFTSMPSIEWNELRVDSANGRAKWNQQEIIIDSIENFIIRYPNLASLVLQQSSHAQWNNVINILAQAAWNHGYVLYIPPNVTIGEPIKIPTIQEYNGSLLIEKLVIIVDQAASVTLIDTPYLLQGVYIRSVDIIILPQAQLTVMQATDIPNVYFFSSVHSVVHQESNFTYYPLITNGMHQRLWLETQLVGTHAHSVLRGAYVLKHQQSAVITTRQTHNAAKTISDITIKGVVTEQASIEYQGTITIEKHAPQSQAMQENKTIVLDPRSRAVSIPNLQVLTHDVMCAHGSAIGQLDAEQLFYVSTRGMPQEVARQLLLEGFLSDVFVRSNGAQSIISRLQSQLTQL